MTTQPSTPEAGSQELAALVEARLRELGAESRTERQVRRFVPWAFSLFAHLAMIFAGFLISWTVVMLRDEEDPPIIVADYDAMTYAPVVAAAIDSLQPQPEVQTPPSEIPITVPQPSPSGAALSAPDLLSRFATGASPPTFTGPSGASVSFVGLSATNARRIVYAIDASGSMVPAFPIILKELARSLDALTPRQEFAIVFFQADRAVAVPPGNRLVPALPDAIDRALKWVRAEVIPAGTSNPLGAIRHALDLEPDVIYLLSEDITGAGEFEIDQADLLSMLDELNPVDAETGRRPARICCVQFLDPDPLRTLERIGQQHGGERGYKLLDRRELGLVEP